MDATVLEIFISHHRIQEASWAIDVIIQEFLGLAYTLNTTGHQDNVIIKFAEHSLTLPNSFLGIAENVWLSSTSLPKLPLMWWNTSHSDLKINLVKNTIPILCGRPGFHQEENGNGHLNLDVFGAAFFMLSRYEELVVTERDKHDRFPAAASIAYEAGFLDRPIVDEYVEILWAAMQQVWPELERKPRQGKVLVSCDVDQPFDRVGSNVKKLFRSIAGDIVKRKDLKLAYKRVRNFIESPKGNLKFDPYYTFDWYMDVCEQNNLKAIFYFITDHTGGAIDGTYTMNEPRVLSLIKKIAERGHEIGVHGSYNSFNDPQQILKERQILVDLCQKLGVGSPVMGNRQHYLRWDSARTPDYLDSAGYEYDTTGSFADMAGFRYGTAREFSMWSWQKKTGLRLKQRPLIVMEGSIISAGYMNLGYTDKAKQTFLDLKNKSLKYEGNFSLLWHNSHLLSKRDRDLFEIVINSQ